MWIVCIVLFIVFLILMMLTWRSQTKEEVCKVKLLLPFYKISEELLQLFENRLLHFRYLKRLATIQEQLHPYSSAREALHDYLVEKAAVAMGILFLGTLIGMILPILPKENKFLEENHTISRNPYGQGIQTRELMVQIGTRDPKRLEIHIQQQSYTKEEVQNLFEEKKEALEREVLASNDSKEQVTQNITFPAYLPETNLEIQWLMSRTDLVDYEGNLLKDQVSDEGEVLTLTAILEYEELELRHTITLCICNPKRDEEETLEYQLQKEIQRIDENTKEHDVLSLPEKLNGEKVMYEEPEEQYGVIADLLLLAGMVVFWGKDWDLKKAVRQRQQQMKLDYPNIVRKIMLFVRAGMTVRGAFYRIAEDYCQRREDGRSAQRFAYDEVVVACRNIQNGMSEQEVYEYFGRRCRVQSYMRLGTLLTQSIRKGNLFLQEQLEVEIKEALEQRKEIAKSAGAELETKLLFPMILLLGVVMIILIVPAFMSMNV